ncbi:5-oxoprolinase subunit PxpA [Marinobacterium maritimum]|uniref:5-oxoprolinase subunit PxpA n=1 Tax=Marinobacterium maritimum TaxID=500162 RepID=A0ABN1IB10_9GAMM
MTIKLNCDLGESFGAWRMGLDSAVMPHIDQANVACGFHAGDPQVMRSTLALARDHQVTVGAHPAYPDLVGFGRRSLNCQSDEIVALMHYQVAALDGMARVQGMAVSYVKPHGALYNDMMVNAEVRRAVMQSLAEYPAQVALMLQATPSFEQHREEAKAWGVELMFEAFADRCYDDDGRLLSRARAGAVLNRESMLQQVEQLHSTGTITTISGHRLELEVDTLCVHGDNEEGIRAIREIREVLQG